MTVCLDGSRPASTVRTDTVLPAPTSPVTTPMDRSLMHQEMRATASLCEAWRCSMPGARSRPNGVLLKPYSLNLIKLVSLQGLGLFVEMSAVGKVCSVRVDGRQTEVGGGGGAPVDLGELVLSTGEADPQSLSFPEPTLSFGFGDASE
jgi:hypothetical protein